MDAWNSLPSSTNMCFYPEERNQSPKEEAAYALLTRRE